MSSILMPSSSITIEGRYMTLKKMHQQKQKELLKQYEKEKKKLKAGGKCTVQAEKQQRKP